MNREERKRLREFLARGQKEELLRHSIPYLTGLVAALPGLLDLADELEERVAAAHSHADTNSRLSTIAIDSARAAAEITTAVAAERDRLKAEVERLTACLLRGNADMERVERDLYLKLQEAESALQKYGRHLDYCDPVEGLRLAALRGEDIKTIDDPCSCGLGTTLEGFDL